MKKILISLGIIGIAAVAVVGATGAYFSDVKTSADNTFTAGTLTISIDQTMETINPVISNWAPGDTELVRFNVDNTGSLPVNLRGFANGTWNNSTLVDTLVKVTKVEYYNAAGNWVTIIANTAGLMGKYYYSSNGTNSGLYELAGGATEQFRLSVYFDSAADNAYQGKTYTASLTMEAKQTGASAF